MERTVVFVEWSVINNCHVILKFSFHSASMKWNRKTSHQSLLYTLIHRWLVLATGISDLTVWLIIAARHKASHARRLLIRTQQILSLLLKQKEAIAGEQYVWTAGNCIFEQKIKSDIDAYKCAHQTSHFTQRSCKNYIGNYQSEWYYIPIKTKGVHVNVASVTLHKYKNYTIV